MKKILPQIALDFPAGDDPLPAPAPVVESPAAVQMPIEAGERMPAHAEEQPVLAAEMPVSAFPAAGVGVRLKAFKKAAEPVPAPTLVPPPVEARELPAEKTLVPPPVEARELPVEETPHETPELHQEEIPAPVTEAQMPESEHTDNHIIEEEATTSTAEIPEQLTEVATPEEEAILPDEEIPEEQEQAALPQMEAPKEPATHPHPEKPETPEQPAPHPETPEKPSPRPRPETPAPTPPPEQPAPATQPEIPVHPTPEEPNPHSIPEIPEQPQEPEQTPIPPHTPAPHTRATATAAPIKSTRGRKSLKQSSAEADLLDIPSDQVLFTKQYYTMGEVAEMFRVNQSLLRFWEAEFDVLKPRKNKKGDRYFRPVDIKNLHLIYHLLRQRKYTIEGAKEFLKKNKRAEERFEAIRNLQQIRAFLIEWRAQL